jgi:hypothetical protein
MSWWDALFGKKTAEEPSKPTYEDLVRQVGELGEKLAGTRREADRFRIALASKSLDLEAAKVRYEQALEFYADEAHWRPFSVAGQIRATSDRGHRARVALGRRT